MISAIILSHNNEDSIGRTLESLDWCDERIVIDDFSTDKTVVIARAFKADIFQRKLHNNFAAQRNFGLRKAKNTWVLFIDSDEVVSSRLAREIQKSVMIDCSGFYLKRQDFIFGRKLMYGETANVKLLRLAKKNTGNWVRPVHEVFMVRGITGILENPLEHYPHPNVAQFIDEINMYSTINARYLFDQKVFIPMWHILVYPVGKFLKNYFYFMGFRDGTPGIIVAIMMSMHSFLTRSKLWLLWHTR